MTVKNWRITFERAGRIVDSEELVVLDGTPDKVREVALRNIVGCLVGRTTFADGDVIRITTEGI